MASDPAVLKEDNLIEKVTANRQPHYEPYGWHHFPEHPWFAYQFRRGLGETQEGGGTVSECFLVASRIIQLDRMIGPVYLPLKAGEFIQGLLA